MARELTDGLRHDLVRGHAVGIPAAVDLDADDVGRREEPPPGVGGRCRAGQFSHASRHHLADDVVVGGVGGGVDALVRLNGDDTAGVGAGHPGHLRWRVGRHDAHRRNLGVLGSAGSGLALLLRRVELDSGPGGRGRQEPNERSAMHRARLQDEKRRHRSSFRGELHLIPCVDRVLQFLNISFSIQHSAFSTPFVP